LTAAGAEALVTDFGVMTLAATGFDGLSGGDETDGLGGALVALVTEGTGAAAEGTAATGFLSEGGETVVEFETTAFDDDDSDDNDLGRMLKLDEALTAGCFVTVDAFADWDWDWGLDWGRDGD
jgi:hypothetical protein